MRTGAPSGERRIRGATGLVALVLLTVLCVPVLASAPSITIEPTRTIFEAGETISFRVLSEGAASVSVPGCGVFQPEVFVEDQYEVLAPPSCDEEGIARVLGPGTNTLELAPRPELVGKTARVSMVYGLGCIEGRPLSRARCSDFKTAWSGNFRLKRASR